MGKQSIALWASGVLHCGRAECCIVGEQSVAFWASGVLHCGRAERCTVGEQSFALWANRVCCIVGERSVVGDVLALLFLPRHRHLQLHQPLVHLTTLHLQLLRLSLGITHVPGTRNVTCHTDVTRNGTDITCHTDVTQTSHKT